MDIKSNFYVTNIAINVKAYNRSLSFNGRPNP